MTDVTTLHDEESVGTMDLFTFCVILGYLVQAERALDDDRAEIVRNRINEAQETFYCWYEYGEAVSLED